MDRPQAKRTHITPEPARETNAWESWKKRTDGRTKRNEGCANQPHTYTHNQQPITRTYRTKPNQPYLSHRSAIFQTYDKKNVLFLYHSTNSARIIDWASGTNVHILDKQNDEILRKESHICMYLHTRETSLWFLVCVLQSRFFKTVWFVNVCVPSVSLYAYFI